MKTFARSPFARGIAVAVIATAGVAAVASASAQELKIGYVNSERVLREAAPAQAAQRKLEAEFGKRQREMAEAEQRLKTAADRLEKDAPTLAAADRTRRERELVEQDRDLQRKRREFQEDLNQRRNEELSAVVERANRAIKQIFDSEKYDLILQEVIFAGPRVDITDKVIRVLNAPAAPAAPAQAPR
jgi:outer membrane protein